jgi:hypothetical protein
MEEFMSADGSHALRNAFEKGDSGVQGKCATFVGDNLLFNRHIDGVDDELTLWCRLFQQYLQNTIPDATSEKVLASLLFVTLRLN